MGVALSLDVLCMSAFVIFVSLCMQVCKCKSVCALCKSVFRMCKSVRFCVCNSVCVIPAVFVSLPVYESVCVSVGRGVE